MDPHFTSMDEHSQASKEAPYTKRASVSPTIQIDPNSLNKGEQFTLSFSAISSGTYGEGHDQVRAEVPSF